jgi:hypothetical protein
MIPASGERLVGVPGRNRSDSRTLPFSYEQSSRVRANISFKEETNMSELQYPNESREYRDARDLLLKDEQELIDKVKSVAERRRNLPPGGAVERGLRLPMGCSPALR